MSGWHVKTTDAAAGKWRGVLLELGVPSSALVNKHGPCPMCGGSDRFRWDNREGRGTFICTNCGAGDGMRLACEFTGKEFPEVAAEIDRIVGNLKPDAPQKAPMDAEASARAIREVAAQCRPVQPGDLVSRYLESRGLKLPSIPSALRFAPQLRDGDGGIRPAMVASVRDADGKAVTLHRTFLKPDGSGKAEMAAPRKLMPGPFPDGGAVRLFEAGETLGIAEGIETALAASIVSGVPVWACLTSGGMAKFRPPECVRHLIVFGDDDQNFAGHCAAFTAAHRNAARKIDVQVRLPSLGLVKPSGTDWNDVLLETADA